MQVVKEKKSGGQKGRVGNAPSRARADSCLLVHYITKPQSVTRVNFWNELIICLALYKVKV